MYVLSSLYYDTHDYRFYREKLDGIRYRRKLRIRCYEKQQPLLDDSVVFVEIKQRVNRVTQKRRAPMTYKEALDLCNEGIVPKHEAKDSLVVYEIYEMVKQYDLKPTCITSYFRHAFFGTDYDAGLRITFDSNIRYRTQNLDLADKEI
jgi:SPX domain protein involved in polyphosphate accumulation